MWSKHTLNLGYAFTRGPRSHWRPSQLSWDENLWTILAVFRLQNQIFSPTRLKLENQEKSLQSARKGRNPLRTGKTLRFCMNSVNAANSEKFLASANQLALNRLIDFAQAGEKKPQQKLKTETKNQIKLWWVFKSCSFLAHFPKTVHCIACFFPFLFSSQVLGL